MVEDLDDLGAEAADEFSGAAERVLPGDASLLVGGGAERKVGLAGQPVMGDDAVAGGEDAGHGGVHLPVYGDGFAGAKRSAGAGRTGIRSPGSPHMNPATIDLIAPDISCAKCKQNIEGDLAGDPGVQNVTVDVTARIVRIAYDERQTSPGRLRARLSEIGYPAAP
jgi:copper chaperone CopZ